MFVSLARFVPAGWLGSFGSRDAGIALNFLALRVHVLK